MKRGIGSVTLSISLPAELAVEIYNEADRQGKDGLLFRPNTSFTHALYRACDCITVTHRAREVAEPGRARYAAPPRRRCKCAAVLPRRARFRSSFRGEGQS